jgi:hypothetical protein
MFPPKNVTLSGFELAPSVAEADAMSLRYARSQSYDSDLQRKRCLILQRHE